MVEPLQRERERANFSDNGHIVNCESGDTVSTCGGTRYYTTYLQLYSVLSVLVFVLGTNVNGIKQRISVTHSQSLTAAHSHSLTVSE